MNILKTGPKFIQGYFQTRKLISHKDEILELRELGHIEEEKEAIRKAQKEWVEGLSKKFNFTYEVTGWENIPDSAPFMVYSNHQSYADIAATLWIMKDRYPMSYVAKDEWRKYSVLRDVIELSRSIYLVRSNPKEAVRALTEAMSLLDQGFPLLIFPEGTRSRRHEMGEFKAGAFKFAEKAKVPILPVTLDGGYHFFEELGTYQPAHIKVTIHPLVHIEDMDKHAQKEAQANIEKMIRGALDR
jgi:1-acyl-sn-glycerol-3-phosphate acyltransferase